ncbi:MAG: hypothetical protein JWN46_899 [Acidimicrobiales bacterium]|nr:hypothetical protein [Acidimicrobiales bacterium]
MTDPMKPEFGHVVPQQSPPTGDPSASGAWLSRPLASNPPPAQLGVPATDPILFAIGDIGVSRYWVVTPNGSAPLAGSRWIGRDLSRTESKTPSWAIVMAIIFALACLVGLFFLMVKEERTTGYFEVSVQSGNLQHVTQLPVWNAAQLAHLRQMVHQAQSMAAAA